MSEEIASVAGLLSANAAQRRQIAALSADLARALSDLAAAVQSRDQALAAAEAERAARVRCETELGTARELIDRVRDWSHTWNDIRELRRMLRDYEEARKET